MDKVAYITGSSRGIGRALTTLLLSKGYLVIGLSRSNDIKHPNFIFKQTDLSDVDQVKSFNFEWAGKAVVLVNNAGSLGEINTVGSVSNDSIHKTMNINTISPQVLSNNFIKTFGNSKGRFHILNISSGAGKRPVTSWATYCASKAALDLFSETIAEELEWKQMANWHIHSCAPGVVDTQMQSEIRSTDQLDFKDVQKFIDFNQNGELFDPTMVAEKLEFVIQHPDNYDKTLISVRDF